MKLFSSTWLANEAEYVPRERALLERGECYANVLWPEMQFTTKVTGKKTFA